MSDRALFRRRQRALGLVPAALALLALPAQAGRPLATEDADVLEVGACEWESLFAHARSRGAASQRAGATQLGCGFGWRSQAAVFGSRSSKAGERTQALGLVGKTALIPRKEESLGLTLAWGLSRVKRPGAAFERDGTSLNLVATTALVEGWTAHANLGWTRSRLADEDSTTWNLAAERTMGGGHDLMGEVYGDDRGRPWLGAGWRWQATPSLSLNASAAVQWETPRERLLTLGFKLGF